MVTTAIFPANASSRASFERRRRDAAWVAGSATPNAQARGYTKGNLDRAIDAGTHTAVGTRRQARVTEDELRLPDSQAITVGGVWRLRAGPGNASLGRERHADVRFHFNSAFDELTIQGEDVDAIPVTAYRLANTTVYSGQRTGPRFHYRASIAIKDDGTLGDVLVRRSTFSQARKTWSVSGVFGRLPQS